MQPCSRIGLNITIYGQCTMASPRLRSLGANEGRALVWEGDGSMSAHRLSLLRRLGPVLAVLTGLSVLGLTTPGVAQRFEYIITFDNVVVEGTGTSPDTPEVAHREVIGLDAVVAQGHAALSGGLPPGLRIAVIPGTTTERTLKEAMGKSSTPVTLIPVKGHADGRATLEQKTADAYASDREILIGLVLTAERPDAFVLVDEPYPLMLRRNDPRFTAMRKSPPKLTVKSPGSLLPFEPGQGTENGSFRQEGFLVETFWAQKTASREGSFKPSHFHPADLSTGFEAQHFAGVNDLHGIFIRSLDGKLFGLKSLRYRVTRNRQIPRKPLSIDDFSTFDVQVLIARSFDPRDRIRTQFRAFPVGLPVGNEPNLPWMTLRVSGFELVDRLYITSTASVDFDDIVLTRREPPILP